MKSTFQLAQQKVFHTMSMGASNRVISTYHIQVFWNRFVHADHRRCDNFRQLANNSAQDIKFAHSFAEQELTGNCSENHHTEPILAPKHKLTLSSIREICSLEIYSLFFKREKLVLVPDHHFECEMTRLCGGGGGEQTNTGLDSGSPDLSDIPIN